MASQWGRETIGPSRGGVRAPVVILACLIFAILGFLGGYATFRLTQPDRAAELAAARTELEDVKQQRDVLQSQLDDAGKPQPGATVPADSTSPAVDRLNAQLARQAEDLDRMTDNLAALSEERSALKQQIEALKADRTADTDRQQSSISEANAEVERLTGELSHLNDTVVPELMQARESLQQRIKVLETERDDMGRKVEALTSENAETSDQVMRLESQLDEAQQSLTKAKDALAAKDGAVEDVQPDALIELSETPPPPQPDALTPRSRSAVEVAIGASSSLRTLSGSERRELTDRLVAGECVTTSLGAVFDRVPVVALRDLISALKSGC